MSELRPVRGTRDFLPQDSRRRRWIEEQAWAVAARYGFGELSTPVFEFTDVFARTLGDTTDIVTKEMYTFTDRSGDSLTLRPENTAGIVRALLSNRLIPQLPLKVFYAGPMFRYERPQKGRLRQFHQVGVELLGVPDPLADVEVIALGADLLAALGLADQVGIDLNTLGDSESRDQYRSALVEFFRCHQSHLSADSLARLERNPLRILDSKDDGDRAIVAAAPLLSDHLNDASRRFFDGVCRGLDRLGIAYRLNPRLVRGLDYYSHTTFEFVTEALGAQGTVLAGGRYDGLVAHMGGPATPGIGWAAGVERLMMLIDEPPAPSRSVAIVPLSREQAADALVLARTLRGEGLTVEVAFANGLGKGLKWANRVGARTALILGADELARHAVAVRDMDTGAQLEVRLADLGSHLTARG